MYWNLPQIKYWLTCRMLRLRHLEQDRTRIHVSQLEPSEVNVEDIRFWWTQVIYKIHQQSYKQCLVLWVVTLIPRITPPPPFPLVFFVLYGFFLVK